MMETEHISELDFLVWLENQLANHRWDNIYQMLADASALLYSEVDYILERRKEYPLIYRFAVLMQRERNHSKGSLDGYSSKQLSWYLYGRIKNVISLDYIRQFAKYLIVIKVIEDDGGITLDESWSDILSPSTGIPDLERKERVDSKIDIQNVQLRDEQPKDVVFVPRIGKTENERKLETYWHKLTVGHFDYLYFWRNKICTQQYQELKSILLACTYDNKRGLVKRFGRVIAFCISEWYKREYNGNDGKENAVKELHLPCRPEEIWKYAGLPDNFLYKQKNNRYLDSLYVLGGLPINYLIHKQFNKVFKEIQSVYQQKESEVSLQNNVFINNNTLQEATRTQWGSLHLYFDELMRDNYPFVLEDQKEEPFRTFISNLQEWNPMRKKFHAEWIIEGNEDVEFFRRRMRLYVMPEFNGERNKSISYGRMSRWGVLTTTKLFRVYALFNGADTQELNESTEFITFYNTWDGYFVGKLRHNYFTFSQLPTGIITKVTLYVKADGSKEKEIGHFDVSPYMQLFKTEKYGILSSRRNDNESYVLLPFDTEVVGQNDGNDKKYFEEGGEAFKLIPVKGFITIKETDGEEKTIYSKDRDLEIEIDPHHTDIKYNDHGCCIHHSLSDEDDQTEELPLLLNKHDLKFKLFEQGHNPKYVKADDIHLQYKNNSEFAFRDWTDNDFPLGVIKVRAIYKNLSAQQTVYSLCSREVAIKRNCSTHTISIADDVPVLMVPEGLEEIEPHLFKDNPEYKDDLDTYVFNIGDENEYVNVPVYRSFIETNLYRDGKVVDTYKELNSHVAIPFLLKDHYSIRSVGQFGVVRLNLSKSNVTYLDFKFPDEDRSIEKKIETPLLTMYYTKEMWLGSQFTIDVDSADMKEYHFYYWSMKESDMPKKIELNAYDGLIQLGVSSKEAKQGMIFQSLEDEVCPRHYFAPIINGSWGDDRQMDELKEKCFAIAAYYKTPFRIFAPIYEYFKGTDSELVDLAVRYLFFQDDLNALSSYEKLRIEIAEATFRNSSNEDLNTFFQNYFVQIWDEKIFNDRCRTLTRFSNEMYFSWLFLNRKTWKDVPGKFLSSIYKPITMQTSKDRDSFTDKKIADYLERNPEIPRIVKEKLKLASKMLFLKSANNSGGENYKSLSNLVSIYWGHLHEKGYRFPVYTNMKWYGYNETGTIKIWSDRSDDLPQQAICFMRPKPIRKNSGRIIGFTNQENSKIKGEVRNIEEITGFLGKLYKNADSFIQIEQFFKRNLFNYNQ